MEAGPQRDKHTKIIGSILVVFGTLMLLSSIFAYNVLDLIFSFNLTDNMHHWDFGVVSIENPMRFFYFIPVLTALYGAMELGAGIGLLNRQVWAEKVSLVLAVFMIFNVPVGTALAIYIFYTFVSGSSTRRHPPVQQH